jgi:hypothetical protein
VLSVTVSTKTRAQARREGRALGKLHGSVTNGRGNETGMLGEILAHQLIGGERVGHRCFSHDIELDNGITVDVKTGRGKAEPLSHYVARVYGAEDKKDVIGSRCDVYYFLRATSTLKQAWVLGWMWADQFIEQAEFLPKGHVGPDGKLTYSDEWVIPISKLNPPSQQIKPRRGHARRKKEAAKALGANKGS